MARAKVVFEDHEPGDSTWYRLETAHGEACPGDGSWADFRAHGEKEATFQWRCRAQELLEEARAAMASGDPSNVSDELEELAAGLAETLGDELLEVEAGTEGEDEDDAEKRRLAAAVREIAEGALELEMDGSLNPYHIADDRQEADCASALPLPRWASWEALDDGGPGSGFTARFLVLEPGRTLAELQRWLEGRGRARKARR